METLRDARTRYFEENRFGDDGGYGATWVDFKLGPLPFRFRNTAGRVRAVRYHDLHHVTTGYTTDLLGELEIAAWELGAGCRDFAAAWVLNLSAMAGGVVRAPRRTWRAFVRGRRAHSLYGRDLDALLGRTVEDIRGEMALTSAPPARAADAPLFAAATLAGVAIGSVLLVAGLILGPVGMLARSRSTWLRRRSDAAAPTRS